MQDITANRSIVSNHNHEVLGAKPEAQHVSAYCENLSGPEHTTTSLLIYYTAALWCLFFFFFSCPDPSIVIQQWRCRADGGDEQSCSGEKQRSFPQVKGLKQQPSGWRWLQQIQRVQTFGQQWRERLTGKCRGGCLMMKAHASNLERAAAKQDFIWFYCELELISTASQIMTTNKLALLHPGGRINRIT